jgi:hypothetical protein
MKLYKGCCKGVFHQEKGPMHTNWRLQFPHTMVSIAGLLVVFIIPHFLYGQTPPTAASIIGNIETAGILSIIQADSSEPGLPSKNIHFMLTDNNGITRELELDEATLSSAGGAWALNGKNVRVSGAIQTGSGYSAGSERILVGQIRGDNPFEPAFGKESAGFLTGRQARAALLCKFADDLKEPRSLAYFQEMWSGPNGLDSYWRELSYDNINLMESQAFGWFTLPHSRSFYLYDNNGDGIEDLDFARITTDCIAAARSGGVNLANFSGFDLVFNDDLGAYSYGGTYALDVTGEIKSWPVTWLPPWAFAEASVVAHEMGHSFGLPHSSGNYGCPYDNQWDVMSYDRINCYLSSDPTYGCLGQHTIAYHMAKLGWLSDQFIVTAPAEVNEQIYALEQLEFPQTLNPRMIKIPIGGSASHYYTAEVRRQIGFDVKLPGQGVIIHEVDETRSVPAHILDIDENKNTGDQGALWLPGETYIDRINGISVAIQAAADTGYILKVSNSNSLVSPIVSGTVTDLDGDPVPGLTVQDNLGHTSVTTGKGNYQFGGYQGSNSITVRVTDSDYSYYPDSRTINVGGAAGSALQQDFRATPLLKWECWDDGSVDPCRHNLNGVRLINSNEGWAVGEQGTILRRLAGAWFSFPSNTTEDLSAVSILASDDAWIAGSKGTILHWNGSIWAKVSSSTSWNLWGIAMVSANDGWAVGDGGLILRWNGDAWIAESSPVDRYLVSVFMLSRNDGWIVGNSGTALHWDGMKWSKIETPTTEPLLSVTMASSQNGWAVGGSSSAAVFLHWDGSSWSTGSIPSGLIKQNAVSSASGSDFWSVGQMGGIPMHWDGAEWKGTNAPCPYELLAVDMVSSNDAWVVGQGGIMLHWNGLNWSVQNASNVKRLFAIDFSSLADGWTVGEDGTALHWNGSAWTKVSTPVTTSLRALSIISPSDVWACGEPVPGENKNLIHWNGDAWSLVPNPVNDKLLLGISMVSATDGWAVGGQWPYDNSSILLHWDGVQWTPFPSPTSNTLFSIIMLSATDGWAVGFGGTILHWDGRAWILSPSPTTREIASVDMINSSDGWAVGPETTHLHYNGDSWTAFPLTRSQYQDAVSVDSSNDAWSVGKRILHWNGNDWYETKWKTPNWLWGAKMLSRTQGWAVGFGGVILRYHPNLSVSGVVMDSTGVPLDRVNVSVASAENYYTNMGSLTNANGRFSLEDLSEGTYTVTPSKSGYDFYPSSAVFDIRYSQKNQLFVAYHTFAKERNALIALYNSANGAGWINNSGWLGSAGTECDWFGITCDETRSSVISIQLGNNNLTGSMPAQIEDLINLQILDLKNNLLNGTIPPSLANLTGLIKLNISYNNLCTNNSTLLAFLNSRQPGWQTTQRAANPNDIDRDGRPDILWRNSSSGDIYVWFMNGTTNTGGGYLPAVPDQNWRIVGMADFNQDGQSDLLWRNKSTGQNYVWFMNGTSNTGGAFLDSVADLNWNIAGIVDFNNDGNKDILWRNTATGDNYVWFMNGTSHVNGAYISSVSDCSWQIAGSGDFSNDGKPDILWRNRSTGENYVWFMNGTTSTGGAYLEPVPNLNWKIVSAGDYNGDGQADVLWRNTATGENYIWFMNGATINQGTYLDKVADTNWLISDIGEYTLGADFDNDDNADLLWRNSSTGENYVWFMNGKDQTSGANLDSVPFGHWKVAGLADFNQDGRVDIMWRNISTGENYVWFMSGKTRTAGAYLDSVTDANWKIVAAADFNKDGKTDILWRNASTGENYVWFMDGATRTSGAYITAVGNLNWKVVGTGDFNRDGKTDILWRNYSTGENYLWYMDGTSLLAGDYIDPVNNVGWKIAAIADFNKDRNPDILWRNESTGENYLWYMNGITHTGGDYLPPVAGQNWKLAPAGE